MKKLLMSLAIASTALTAAAPAAAQYYGRDRYQDRFEDRSDRLARGSNVSAELRQLNLQINRSFERGALTRGEFRRLHGEVQNLYRLASRFHSSGGYDRREHFELQRRIGWVREQLRQERRDGDRRNWR